MVFDIRGRRKRVVQVVYAVLAVLMGLSLFFVTGGLSLDQLFGGGGTTSINNQIFDKQAAAIERKLKQNPEDPTLLLALTKTRINSGRTLSTTTATGQQSIPIEAQQEYQKAISAWNKYLGTNPAKPNPNVALLVAGTDVSLAQTATTSIEAQQYATGAAKAEGIYAKIHPSAWGNVAYYYYAALNFKAGDAATKKAVASATKAQSKPVEKSLAKIRKQAKAFQAQLKKQEKATKGQGKQELQNPLGGLGGGGTGLTAP